MQSDRLEAFSDGVLAIIITIMVLELNVPEGDALHDLWAASGLGLLTYLLVRLYRDPLEQPPPPVQSR